MNDQDKSEGSAKRPNRVGKKRRAAIARPNAATARTMGLKRVYAVEYLRWGERAASEQEAERLESSRTLSLLQPPPGAPVDPKLIEALRPVIADEVRRMLGEILAEAGSVNASSLEGLDRPLPLRTTSIDQMLAPAVARFDALAGRLDRDPDMLDAAAFAERIGMTVQGLHAKRKRGEALGLMQSKRKVWFPLWQIGSDGRLLAGLANLHEVFGGDPWRVHRFLLTPHGAIQGLTGLQALRSGRIAEALTAARATCDGSFS